MFPLSPNYCKERFLIQLNWRGAGRTLFEGCSLGPPGRISVGFWKPWSKLFHEQKQRGPFLKTQDSLGFFRAHTLFSNAKINSAWPREIHLRSQEFLLYKARATFSVLANETRRVARFLRFF